MSRARPPPAELPSLGWSTRRSAHPIVAALREAEGNVSRAALLLGISRAKVRRFIDKAGVDVAGLRKK